MLHEKIPSIQCTEIQEDLEVPDSVCYQTERRSQKKILVLLKSTFEDRTIFLMPWLIETVAINNSHIKNITPRTLLRWLNDFEKSDYRGFKGDDKGENQSEYFITDSS